MHIPGNLAFGVLLVTAIAVEVVLGAGPATRGRTCGGARGPSGRWRWRSRSGTSPRGRGATRRRGSGTRGVAPVVRGRGVPAVPGSSAPNGSRIRCGRLRSGHGHRRPLPTDPTVTPWREAGHDFDFWIGDWDVFGPLGKQVGRNTITSMFAGGDAARALARQRRRRRPQRQRVRRGSRLLAPDLGGLHRRGAAARRRAAGRRNGVGGAGPERRGDPTVVDRQRITWTRGTKTPRGPRSLWESSSDDGATWTVTVDGRYRRRPPAGWGRKRITKQAQPVRPTGFVTGAIAPSSTSGMDGTCRLLQPAGWTDLDNEARRRAL